MSETDLFSLCLPLDSDVPYSRSLGSAPGSIIRQYCQIRSCLNVFINIIHSKILSTTGTFVNELSTLIPPSHFLISIMISWCLVEEAIHPKHVVLSQYKRHDMPGKTLCGKITVLTQGIDHMRVELESFSCPERLI